MYIEREKKRNHTIACVSEKEKKVIENIIAWVCTQIVEVGCGHRIEKNSKKLISCVSHGVYVTFIVFGI